MTEPGSNPSLTRRAMLYGGAAAITVTGTGAVVVGFDEALGLGGERLVFDRLVSVVLSVSDESPWPSPVGLPVLDHIEHTLDHLDPDLRSQLGAGLKVFNHSAVVLGPHLRPFVMLGDAAALAHCRSWEQGTAMQAGFVHIARTLVRMSYLRDDATWEAMHYEGPVSGPRRYPRLGNAPLPPEDRQNEPGSEGARLQDEPEVTHGG